MCKYLVVNGIYLLFGAAEGYRAMEEGRAIKALLRPEVGSASLFDDLFKQ